MAVAFFLGLVAQTLSEYDRFVRNGLYQVGAFSLTLHLPAWLTGAPIRLRPAGTA
ncbi:hypothetical protein AB0K80_11485 [Streptomyces sp. NPDC052682]|uniref:hypothetical protein n=1 Tax=Streptomyces sp. NPDC052682 TaxID=3154954 RepID=UPI003415B3B7